MTQQRTQQAAALLKRIAHFNTYQGPTDLELAYLDFITDTDNALADRWAVFTEAPAEWKNHEVSGRAPADICSGAR